MGDDGIRLNKFLSGAGICSRREADRLIEEGKVTVGGRTAVPGQKIKNGETVVCNGRTIAAGTKGAEKKPDRVLLAVHKPCGIVCTTSDKDRAPNIVDMVDSPVRIYPVGRLDKDSEGLILMTNQGDLVNRLMRGSNGHEKEYLVFIDDKAVFRRDDGRKIVPYCTDPGTESPDPQDVRAAGLQGAKTEACQNHEYRAGRSKSR